MIYYEDNDIKIRNIIDEDITSLFSWWIDKEVNKYDPRPIPSNSKNLMKECTNYCNRFDGEIMNEKIEERRYKYFIIVNHEDIPIGFVNIFNFEKKEKQVEMGVIIGDKRYWKKGIAYRSIKNVTSYIFSNMNIERIYIETSEGNIPALKLFNKLNFNKCDEYLEDEKYKFIVMEKRKTV